jgi:pSer/pThr/pTyr-binding forkhead associated (FHA) protein
MASSESLASTSLSESFAAACKLSAAIEIRAVHRSTGASQFHAISQPFAFIGRAKPLSVRLDDPSVSQCHAYLQVFEGLPYCIDLGSRTGVLWDDGGQGRGWVHPGQTLRLGMFDVQIGISGKDPLVMQEEPRESGLSHDESPLAVLEVHSPTGTTGNFVLDRAITLVGRHPNCNLRFLDDALSYFQCALVKTPAGVWCVDILSRKGTVLNGRLTRLAQLRDGDLIELGKVSMLLHYGSQPGQPLALGASTALQTTAPAAITQQTVADSVASAFVPFREMMEQFQQCFVTMARMFTTMQQEHTSMMCEQMRQIQELLQEMRADSRKGPALPAGMGVNGTSVSPGTPTPTPRTSPLPSQKPPEGAEAQVLADAHTWFLDRLEQLAQTAAGKPKRD